MNFPRHGRIVSATVRELAVGGCFNRGVVVGFFGGSFNSSASGGSGTALFVAVSLFSVVLSTSAPTTAAAQPGPDQSGRIPVELVPASPRSDTSVPGLMPAPAAPLDRGVGKPPPAPEQPVPPLVIAPVAQTKVPRVDVGPVGEVASERTERSSTVRNADGSMTLEMSPLRVNFRGLDGAWTPIDTRVVRSETDRDVLTNAADNGDVSFAPLSKGGVTVTSATGGVFSFAPIVDVDIAPTVSKDAKTVYSGGGLKDLCYEGDAYPAMEAYQRRSVNGAERTFTLVNEPQGLQTALVTDPFGIGQRDKCYL